MNFCRQPKLYSFRMEVNIPEQLLTDIGHNSSLVFLSSGENRSAEKSISWTSLVHILAPPIVSAVIPTPKYPNWRAHSFRGRNSSLTPHPCSSLLFYLLNVYKTWRYSEKKQKHSRHFPAVYDCNELPKHPKDETFQCVFDSSSHWDAFSHIYHQWYLQTSHPIPQRELFISQNLFGNHLFWKNCYQNPLYDSKLYLSLKKIKIKLNFHNTCFHIQIIIMLYKNLQSFQWLFEMETKTEEIVLSF